MDHYFNGRNTKSPFWQMVIIDDHIQFKFAKSITGDMNVIQSVNKYGYY